MEEVDVSKQLARQQAEEKRLAEMMIPKKHRRLYHKIAYKKKKISQEVGHVVLARVLVFVYANGRGGKEVSDSGEGDSGESDNGDRGVRVTMVTEG